MLWRLTLKGIGKFNSLNGDAKNIEFFWIFMVLVFLIPQQLSFLSQNELQNYARWQSIFFVNTFKFRRRRKDGNLITRSFAWHQFLFNQNVFLQAIDVCWLGIVKLTSYNNEFSQFFFFFSKFECRRFYIGFLGKKFRILLVLLSWFFFKLF